MKSQYVQLCAFEGGSRVEKVLITAPSVAANADKKAILEAADH